MDKVKLPEMVWYRPSFNGGGYGADYLLGQYAGLKETPIFHRCFWQHGWVPQHRQFDPRSLMGLPAMPKKNALLLVARKDEESYLRSNGYSRATAIGLPFCYAPSPAVNRIPNSLLVMPQHSLEYNTRNWKFSEYVDVVRSLKDDFERIVVCVHSSCVAHSYWVDEFASAGIEVIEGARLNDRNCLSRMRHIMEQFETMTTNGIGSHVVYACASGTKVAVFGDYAESKAEHYKNDLFFRANPDLLAPIMEAVSSAKYRELYPFLFCHPAEAKASVDWAKREMGWEQKKQPNEIRSLVGMGTLAQTNAKLRGRVKKTLGTLAGLTKKSSGKNAAIAKNLIPKIRKLPRFTVSEIQFQSKPLKIDDPDAFLLDYERFFETAVLKFHDTSTAPIIVDASAGVGVATLWLSKNFPNAQITAFEPNEIRHQLLEQNLAAHGATNVTTRSQYVWKQKGQVPFRDSEGTPFRKAGDSNSYSISPIESVDIAQEFDGQEIALLKLKINDSEIELIEHLAGMLANVSNVYVEYESFAKGKQKLSTLLDVLDAASFRFHILADNDSGSPFISRRVRDGVAMRLAIFAIRI